LQYKLIKLIVIYSVLDFVLVTDCSNLYIWSNYLEPNDKKKMYEKNKTMNTLDNKEIDKD